MEKDENKISSSIPKEKEKENQNITISPNSFKDKVDCEVQHLLTSPMNTNINNKGNIFNFNNKEKNKSEESMPEQEEFKQLKNKK